MFEVGFGRKCISPIVGSILAGYPGGRKSKSLHDDLQVNVFAFRQDREIALMISFDLICLANEIVEEMRSILEKETSVPKNNIILAAIHTHSGPCTMRAVGWCDIDRDYVDQILYPKTVSAVRLAIEKLQPARMGIGETESVAGINRRERCSDGSITLGQRPDGVLNRKMYVLSFSDMEGQPIANLIHYGAHPTAAGKNIEITRDWPGFMTDYLQKISGAKTVFFNGALGDIGPRLSNGKTIGDLQLAKEIGEQAGSDATRAWEGIEEYFEPKLSVKHGTLHLPYQQLPSKQEAEGQLAKLSKKEKLFGVEEAFFDKYQKVLKMYEHGETPLTEWSWEQTYIALGPVVFVPYPLEMFSQIAMDQQEAGPFPYTLCLSNANGYISYLPTEEEIPYGGYEIDSFYSGFYSFEESAAHQIVEENHRLLNLLFE